MALTRVLPHLEKSYIGATPTLTSLVNAAKTSIYNQRTFLDKLIDFFSTKVNIAARYGERLNDFIEGIGMRGSNNHLVLRQQTVNLESKNTIYTYSLVSGEHELVFDSPTEHLTGLRIATDILDHAAFQSTRVPGYYDNKEYTPSSELRAVGGEPLSQRSRYLLDGQGNLLINCNARNDNDLDSSQALEMVCTNGLRPIRALVMKDMQGTIVAIPCGKRMRIGDVPCTVTTYNKSLTLNCEVKDARQALNWVKQFQSRESHTVSVDIQDAAGLHEYCEIAKDMPFPMVGVTIGPVIGPVGVTMGPSVSTLMAYDTSGASNCISFVAKNIVKTAEMIGHLTADIIARREMLGQLPSQENLEMLIKMEQIFDGDTELSAAEMSHLLAQALCRREPEPVTYSAGPENADPVLLISPYGKERPLPVSFRLGSAGEGRGQHILQSLEGDTVSMQRLWESFVAAPRVQQALEILEGLNREELETDATPENLIPDYLHTLVHNGGVVEDSRIVDAEKLANTLGKPNPNDEASRALAFFKLSELCKGCDKGTFTIDRTGAEATLNVAGKIKIRVGVAPLLAAAADYYNQCDMDSEGILNDMRKLRSECGSEFAQYCADMKSGVPKPEDGSLDANMLVMGFYALNDTPLTRFFSQLGINDNEAGDYFYEKLHPNGNATPEQGRRWAIVAGYGASKAAARKYVSPSDFNSICTKANTFGGGR